jgi:hypothetical protein
VTLANCFSLISAFQSFRVKTNWRFFRYSPSYKVEKVEMSSFVQNLSDIWPLVNELKSLVSSSSAEMLSLRNMSHNRIKSAGLDEIRTSNLSMLNSPSATSFQKSFDMSGSHVA